MRRREVEQSAGPGAAFAVASSATSQPLMPPGHDDIREQHINLGIGAEFHHRFPAVDGKNNLVPKAFRTLRITEERNERIVLPTTNIVSLPLGRASIVGSRLRRRT